MRLDCAREALAQRTGWRSSSVRLAEMSYTAVRRLLVDRGGTWDDEGKVEPAENQSSAFTHAMLSTRDRSTQCSGSSTFLKVLEEIYVRMISYFELFAVQIEHQLLVQHAERLVLVIHPTCSHTHQQGKSEATTLSTHHTRLSGPLG